VEVKGEGVPGTEVRDGVEVLSQCSDALCPAEVEVVVKAAVDALGVFAEAVDADLSSS